MQSSLNLRRALAVPRLRFTTPPLTKSAAAIGVAALLTMGVYASILYLYRTAEQDRSTARARLSELRAEWRDIQASAPDLSAVEADQSAAQRAVDEFGRGMVGSAERLALVETLAGLAQRNGIEMRTLALADGGASEPNEAALLAMGRMAGVAPGSGGAQSKAAPPNSKAVEPDPYVTIPVAMGISGDGPAVVRFIDTLQSGIVPGLTVAQAHLTTEEGVTTANLSLRVLAWPTTAQTFTVPAPLQTTTGPGNAAASAAPIGGASQALLAWEVRGRAGWTDHLVSTTLRSNATDGRVTSFALYAETSGDDRLDPALDTLVASAAPGPDGVAVLSPGAPYPFKADAGVRLYVTANVSPITPAGASLEVWLDTGDVAYASMTWPPASEGVAYRSSTTLQPDR